MPISKKKGLPKGIAKVERPPGPNMPASTKGRPKGIAKIEHPPRPKPPTPKPNTEYFIQRFQCLPLELRIWVRDLVFTTPGGTFRISPGSYASIPPNRLVVSRAARAQFAVEYYGNSTFIFQDDRMLGRWLACIDMAHLDLIRWIRVSLDARLYDFQGGDDIRRVRKDAMDSVLRDRSLSCLPVRFWEERRDFGIGRR